MSDLRYAIRQLGKRPLFTVVVVATLALGIGATTTMFSVVNGVLLEAPAYREPDRLMRLYLSTHEGNQPGHLNPMDLIDLRAAESVNGIAFRTRWEPTLTGVDRPLSVRLGTVSPNFFGVLGVQPAAGRWFRQDEGESGNEAVLVLSHALWLNVFGGDPDVIGSSVNIQGVPHTIVGVAPAEFEDPFADPALDGFVPWVVDPENRGGHFMRAVVRLAPGTTRQQAASELNAIFAGIAERYTFKQGRHLSLVPLGRAMVADARTPLLILLGAVALVLAIVCLNVAHLMFARAVDRSRDVAVRMAVGATRGRLLRQLLTESLVLAAVGGAAGFLLTTWMIAGLTAKAPVSLPRLAQVEIDGRVLGFALALTTVTAVAFGLWPALRASSIRVHETLRDMTRAGTGIARAGTRRGLVVAEVALSVCLLIAAGLMVRTVVNLLRVDTGFHSEQVLTFTVSTPSSRYPTGSDVDRFYDRLGEALAAQPGVAMVGAVNMLPLSGSWSCNSFALDDRSDSYLECAEERMVRRDYFPAMGIRTIAGRTFGPEDGPGDARVAVINQTMARRFWPDGDPIGARFKWGSRESGEPWATIVGVVADVKHYGLERDAAPEAYLSHAQLTFPSRSWTFAVQASDRAAAALANAVRNQVRALDPDIAIRDMVPMGDRVAAAVAPWRFTMVLLLGFAATAGLLAALGLYGVLAFSVAQRQREIGIRMAIGAQSVDVLRDVMRQGAGLTGTGVVAGLLAAFVLTRLMRSLLFGVGVTDPVVFTLVPIFLGGVALLATYLPARRATRIDPLEALRHE